MSLSNVVLVGPASPRDVADLLTGSDRKRAERISGYRGIPVSELARALVALGLHVEVVTTAHEVEEFMEFEGPQFRLRVAPMRSRARDLALSLFRDERESLKRLITSCEGGVVHAHWTYEFAWAALDSGRPVVVTAHDAPVTILRHYRDAYRAIRTAMAYLVRFRARALTAVSPYLAERWRREMAYRRPIAVIPNSAPRLLVHHAQAPKALRIVDVADAGRRKNVSSLVRAFRLLRERLPALELDLLGAGLGESDPLPTALRREGSCEGVRFLGTVDRAALASSLANAAVFVHPSREECCSTAVLEAMQAGVPVVAGRTAGGIPWMLDYGRAGLLVDIERPTAIAEGIAGLLDNSDRAQRFSARARQRVEELFSPAAVASAYVHVYERVLAGAA